MSLRPVAVTRKELTLVDLLERILDKGIVLHGDITVTVAGVDLLSLKINLVIASLETAKRYGIELPWEKWAREREEMQASRRRRGRRIRRGASALEGS